VSLAVKMAAPASPTTAASVEKGTREHAVKMVSVTHSITHLKLTNSLVKTVSCPFIHLQLTSSFVKTVSYSFTCTQVTN